MSDWPKDPSGLFRFRDLESIEVEKKPVFPDPTRPREEKPALDLGELADVAMADAIRAARERLGPQAADDPLPPPPELPERAPNTEDLDAVVSESAALAAAGGAAPAIAPGASRPDFQSADQRAVEAAVAEDRRRRRARSRILAVALPLLILGGAGGAAAVLLQPPLLQPGSHPVHSPALSQRLAEPEVIDLAMIPPPPTLVETPEVVPEAAPERTRARSRSRERTPQRLDRGDLF
jgi:hypothetical protein